MCGQVVQKPGVNRRPLRAVPTQPVVGGEPAQDSTGPRRADTAPAAAEASHLPRMLIANAFFHHKFADPPDGTAWDHGSIANWTRRSGIHGADAGVILFCKDFHWYFILVDMNENAVRAGH